MAQVLDFKERVYGRSNGYEVVGTPSFQFASKLKLLKEDIRRCLEMIEVKIKDSTNVVGEMERVEGLRELDEGEY